MLLLVVCTGNICRSPMARALLAAKAVERGLPLDVDSAGLVTEGEPADPHAVSAMARRGIDLSGHRSRLVTDSDLEAADLVMTMAVEHIVELAGRRPEAFGRIFTLKELVGRGTAVGTARPGELAGWLARVHAGRSPMQLLGAGTSDDVADPLGRGRRAFERTAVELDELLDAFLDLFVPGLAAARDH